MSILVHWAGAAIVSPTGFFTLSPREAWLSIQLWALNPLFPRNQVGECAGAEGDSEAGDDCPCSAVREVAGEGSLGQCPVTQEQTPGSQGARAAGGGMGVPRKLVGRVGDQAQGVSSPSAFRRDAAC